MVKDILSEQYKDAFADRREPHALQVVQIEVVEESIHGIGIDEHVVPDFAEVGQEIDTEFLASACK